MGRGGLRPTGRTNQTGLGQEEEKEVTRPVRRKVTPFFSLLFGFKQLFDSRVDNGDNEGGPGPRAVTIAAGGGRGGHPCGGVTGMAAMRVKLTRVVGTDGNGHPETAETSSSKCPLIDNLL